MAAPDAATGIYIYDEADAAAPFSTTLNKLGTSAKNALVQLQTRATNVENKLGLLRLQQVFLAIAAGTPSGTQVGIVNVNRATVATRVSIDILGTLTPSGATIIGLNSAIDAPGVIFIAPNHTVNAAAAAASAYASNRTYDIPGGVGTITIRFVLAVGAGTGSGTIVITAQTFLQGEF